MPDIRVGDRVKVVRPGSTRQRLEGCTGFVDKVYRDFNGSWCFSVGGIAGGHVSGSRGFVVFRREELDHA